ncbi:DUF7507 domain-containing protein [Deminuibacter soli]|uniref:DUF11 domain-containing protein n=1 Tax=Deminuibacter soli TaxID=2291815 RepID=A0A3E1NGD9_9BACT|nr:gliding motility-associated C-terminal domain-containing protein [Deminuibacter soli]RFM26858.1 DUF11 domain-containing protein [Deminuibacter soli]
MQVATNTLKKVCLSAVAVLFIAAAYAIPTISVNVTAGNCKNNGIITVTAANTTGTVLYALIAPSQLPFPQQTNNVFSGLPSGSYTIAVYDNTTGATPVTKTVSLTNNYTDPSVSSVSPGVAATEAYGYCGPQGTIAVTVKNGRAPYTYQLMDATGTTPIGSPLAVTGTSGTLTRIAIGTYTVRITDACGTSFITGQQTVTQDNDISKVTLSNLSVSSTWAEQLKINTTCDGVIAQSFPNLLPMTFTYTNGTTVSMSYRYLQGRMEIPAGSGNWSAWGPLDQTLTLPYAITGESFTVNYQVNNPCTNQTLNASYTYPRLEYTLGQTNNSTTSTMCDPGKQLSITFSGNVYNWSTKVCYPISVTLTEQGNPSNVKNYTWTSSYPYYITDAIPGTTYNVTIKDAKGVTRSYTYLYPAAIRDAISLSTYVEPCDFNSIRFYFTSNSLSKGPFPITYTILNGPAGTVGTAVTVNNSTDLNSQGSSLYTYPFTNMPWGNYIFKISFGNPVCRTDTITRSNTQTYKDLKLQTLNYVQGNYGCGYYDITGSARYTTVSGFSTTTFYAYLYRGTTLVTSFYSSNGTFTFSNQPAGTYTVKIYSYINISGSPSICSAPFDQQNIVLPDYNLPLVNKQLSGGLVCVGQTTGQLHVSASGLAPIRFRVKPQGTPDASYSAYQLDSNFNNLTPGVYTVLVEDGCGGRIAEDITLSNAATASLLQVTGATAANTVCPGSSFGVNVTPIGTVSSVQWTLPDNSTVSGVLSISVPSFAPANAGVYRVQVVSTAGCSVSSSVTIGTATQPTLVVNNPAPVCAGTAVNLAAPAITAGSSSVSIYAYYSDTTATSPLPGSTVTPPATTTYYIQALSADYCAAVKPVIVPVKPLPAVFKPSAVTTCNGQTVAAIPLSGSVLPNTIYTWTGGAAIGITDGSSTTGIPAFIAVNTGSAPLTRTITVYATADGCSGTAQTFTVTVNPIPQVNQPANAVVCNGQQVAAIPLSGSTVTGTLYNWTGGSSIGLPDGNGTTIPAFPAINNSNAPVTATLSVVPVANNCSGVAQSFTITVNPTATVNKPANIVSCTGQQVTAISLSGNVAGAVYSWTGGAAVGLPDGSGTAISAFTAVNNTSTPVTSAITVVPSANGCTGVKQTFTVTVNPAVTVNQPVNLVACANTLVAPITLTGSSVPGQIYSWTGGSAIGLQDGSGTSIPSFTAVNAGTAPVIANINVTAAANGCAGNSQLFSITVNPLPSNTTVSVTPNLADLSYNKVVSLTATASGAASYQWYKNGTALNGAIAAVYTINGYMHDDAGTYTVEAISSEGCRSNTPGALALPDVQKFDTWKLVADASGNNLPEAGEILTYTIYVKNTGTIPIAGINIKDTIPPHTSYQSGGTYQASDNTVNFTLSNLAAGQTQSVVFTAKLDADLTGVDSVYNHAVVQGDTITHNTGCSEDQPNGECYTPLPTNQIKAFDTWKVVADQDGNDQAHAGETLTYTIHVKNTGSVTIGSISITDPIPAHTSFVTGSAGGGVYNSTTNTVSYSWSNLKVEQDTTVSFSVLVNNDITGVTVISNQATVTGDTITHTSGCGEKDVNGSCTTDIPVQGTKHFDTWKTVADDNGDGKAQSGERLVYTIHVKNTGSVSIENITVTDKVPAFTSFVAGSSGGGIYNSTDSSITYTWQNLKVGQDTSLSFAAMVYDDISGADSIFNHATVRGDTTTHTTGCSETTAADSCHTPIVVQVVKDFEAWKTVSDSSGNGLAEGGERITYTIHVKNTGNVTIASTIIKDTIPSHTTLIAGSAGNGTYNAADSSINYIIAGLAVGKDTSVSFSVRLDSDITNIDTVRNHAHVQGDTLQRPTGCSEATAKDSCNTDIPTDKIKQIATWKLVAGAQSGGKAAAGDTLTYTIHVKNTGTVVVEQVIITDTIPSYTDYVSSGGGLFNSADSTITFSWNNLKVGQDTSVQFKVKVLADITGADTIRNRALANADTLIHYTGCSEAAANDSCGTNIPVIKVASFTAWKTVADANGNGLAEANELLTYTIHVKNTGSVRLNNVLVNDTLPQYTTLVNAGSGSYNPVSRLISFSIGELAVGKDSGLVIQARVNNDVTGADSLFNHAVVSTDTITHTTGCSEATAGDSCTVKIPVQVIKTFDTWKLATKQNSSDTAMPGEIVTYTIHVKNTGNAAISNVIITDTVPMHTGYLPGSGGIFNATDCTVSFSWTNLRVGQDTSVAFSVQVNADVTAADTIRNKAFVTGDTTTHETGCSESTPNGACSTDIPVNKIKAFKTWKLVADSSGDGKAQSGELLTYTIYVKNTGNVTINDIDVYDTVPAHTSYLGSNGSYDTVYNSVTFSASNLAVGAVASFTLRVRVTEDLTGIAAIVNTAFAAGDTLNNTSGCSEAKANGACTTDIPTDAVKKFKTWKLVTDSNGDGKPGADELITYAIHVKNTGNVTINNILVKDTIPAHTTYAPGSGGLYNPADNSVTFSFSNLQVKKDTVLRFQVQVNHDITNADTIRNHAWVTGDSTTHPTGCSESTANSDCETIIPTNGIKASEAWKTVADADGDYIAQPGEILTYTLHVRNTGNVALTNLLLYDTIPAGTSYIAGSGGVLNGARVDFTGITIPVDSSAQVSFRVLVTTAAANGGVIANIAYVHTGDGPDVPTCNKPDGCPDGGGDSTVIPVNIPVYYAWKTVADADGDKKASPGEQLTYTIHIRNTGTVQIRDLLVFDTIPVHTTYVAASGGVLNGSRVTFANINIAAGDSATAEFKVTVNADVNSSDFISNIAFLTDNSGNTTPTCTTPTNCNGGDSTIIPIGPAQYIAWKTVSDSSGDGFAQPGELLVYTIHIRNTGAIPLSRLLVYDSIPQFTTYVAGSGGQFYTGRIAFNNIAVPVNDSVALSFSVRVAAVTGDAVAISNMAFVRDNPQDPDKPTCTSPAGCPQGDTTLIPVKPNGYLAWKTVSDAGGNGVADPGEILTYTIHIRNLDAAAITGLLVYDTIPALTTYVSGSGGTLNGERVEFANLDIPAGDSAALSFSVTVAAVTDSTHTIRNIAWVHNASGGPDKPTCSTPSNCTNGDTTVIPVKPAGYIAWKTVSDASGDGKAQPGEILTYTIHIKNQGGTAIRHLLVYDTIPAYTTYIAGSGGTANGPRIEFSNVTVQPGDSIALVFKVTTAATLNGAADIRNIAYLHDDSGGGDKPTCNTPAGCTEPQPTLLPVAELVAIKINKQSSSSTPGAGNAAIGVNELYYYLITVTNEGTTTAHQLTVTDTLAPVLSYKDNSADKGTATYNQPSRIITWVIDSLQAGEHGGLTISVSSPQAGTIVNNAAVTSNEDDINPADNTATVTTDILSLNIPNVITPNGDGFNDKFVIKGLDLYAENLLVIFNRWNNKVYEQRNYGNDWTGSKLNAGTYFYELKLKDKNGQWHSYKGYITLQK